MLRIKDGYDTRMKKTVKEHPNHETRIHSDVGKGNVLKSAIGELIKGMKDLQLKFTKLEKGGSLGVKQKPKEGEKSVLHITN